MKAQEENTDRRYTSSSKERTWIKMGRLYRRIPMLKYIDPLLIPFVILIGGLAYITMTYERVSCSCEQQIRDDELTKAAAAGNKEVADYLNRIDDFWNCNVKRQALLRKLNLPDQWK